MHLITHSEQLVISFSAYIIAKCLSVRLLILHVLGWRGVMSCSGMEFVTLRNATKGVACAQTSVSFKNAFLFTKSCIHLTSLSFSVP